MNKNTIIEGYCNKCKTIRHWVFGVAPIKLEKAYCPDCYTKLKPVTKYLAKKYPSIGNKNPVTPFTTFMGVD